jgi:hypothetical protein
MTFVIHCSGMLKYVLPPKAPNSLDPQQAESKTLADPQEAEEASSNSSVRSEHSTVQQKAEASFAVQLARAEASFDALEVQESSSFARSSLPAVGESYVARKGPFLSQT